MRNGLFLITIGIGSTIALATPTVERPETYKSRSKLGPIAGEGLLYCDQAKANDCAPILLTEGRTMSIANQNAVRGLIGEGQAVRVSFAGKVIATSIFTRSLIRLSAVDTKAVTKRPDRPQRGTLPASILRGHKR